jgi:N-acetyl-anhydromuramyl-L-alanine amidase AmpD
MPVAALGAIKYLTIHCAATPEGRDVSALQICSWDQAKFGQTSYHWVVELSGKAVRTLRDDRKGAHVAKNNTGNIGVCYVGGMDKDMHKPQDTRNDAQKAAIIEIIKFYQEKYPAIIIRGHNEWPGVTKACPSFSVQDWLKAEGVKHAS